MPRTLLPLLLLLNPAAVALAAPALAAPAPPLVERKVDWAAFLARHDLVWERLPAAWDEGAFLGNGLLGVMVYQESGTGDRQAAGLRFDVGRSDVTDQRPTDGSGFGEAGVVWNKPRLPIGRFVLTPAGHVTGGTMRLDLYHAEARGVLTTDKGRIAWKAFVHAIEHVIVVELEASEGEAGFKWSFVPEESKSPRGSGRNQPPAGYRPNLPPREETANGVSAVVQPLLAGGAYATAWAVAGNGPRRAVFASVGYSHPKERAREEADAAVRHAANDQPLDRLEATHRDWWARFYPASFVSIPDTRLEGFYWIQMYKLGSATRADRPAIDLMGPWYRTTAWPAVWWNLNIQLTYMPVYAANRLDLGESLTRMMDRGAENFVLNVPKDMQADSAGIGRVSSYDCRSDVMAVPPGNTPEFGNLTWACQNYWRQYRYSMDDQMLREHLFPLLRRSVNFYLHHLKRGEDGKLHLPPTMSPEYGVAPDCNYDLALLRWGCQTLLAAAGRLKIDDPLIPKWKEVLSDLAPFPTNENGYMVGAGVPFAKSHRHYSHLFMIYPLHLADLHDPAQRKLAEKSLDHWLGLRGGHKGYTYSGAAAMLAAMGRGTEASNWLNILLDQQIRPNTMYLEGSPVIETPLSGAESLHEMLLQSWDGSIHVFPAVPEAWKDVTIDNLRAEGGFLVSAVRWGGKTRFVRIESLAGEPCWLRTDFARPPKVLAGNKVALNPFPDGSVEVGLAKGEAVVIGPEGGSPDLTIAPVEPDAKGLNYFGLPTGKAAR